MRGALYLVAILALPAVLSADPPKPKVDAGAALGALTGGQTTAALAGNLRAFLLDNFPDPLFEDASHWNLQKRGPRGKWRNDGRWWKARIEGRNLRDTLLLDLRDVQQPGGGLTTFTLFVSFDAGIQLDRQTWMMGARLHSGSTRARCRVRLTLRCEALTKFEKGKKLLPDAIFRLRVVQSNLEYDNVVVEHVAGVGGEAAKLLGEAVIDGIRQMKPSLERNLRERANTAIVKAADTKEVRLNLFDLFSEPRAK